MYEEEVRRILKMVEEGKLSPEEGAKLIDALGVEKHPTRKGKYIRIYIHSEEGDEVNIKIPLKLVKVATKLIPKKFAKMKLNEGQVIDLSELLSGLEDEVGDYIDIKSEDGDIVKISVE